MHKRVVIVGIFPILNILKKNCPGIPEQLYKIDLFYYQCSSSPGRNGVVCGMKSFPCPSSL